MPEVKMGRVDVTVANLAYKMDREEKVAPLSELKFTPLP